MLSLLQNFRRMLPFPARPVGTPKQLELRAQAARLQPLRVIIGAGPTAYPGWLATDMDSLNVLRAGDWGALLGRRRLDALLAEHVWEHLTPHDVQIANRNCFDWLKPGGRFRLAVPDGLHPEPAYREWVRPGGSGPGADDHKLLYDYRTLSASLTAAGFKAQLLEYWDESGRFNFNDWSSDDGHIHRSKRYDKRNQNGTLSYTSLIVDAIKPK